jgi:hypothetical protein
VVFDSKMIEFVKKNVTEFVGGEKNNLPIKIEIAGRRTGTESGFLIPNCNFLIFKTKLLG